MRVSTLLNGVTTNVNGTAVNPQIRQHDEAIVQYELTGGTGNINIQGRLHPDAPWHNIVTVSASGAQKVSLFPYMRGATDTVSGATISVWLQHE